MKVIINKNVENFYSDIENSGNTNFLVVRGYILTPNLSDLDKQFYLYNNDYDFKELYSEKDGNKCKIILPLNTPFGINKLRIVNNQDSEEMILFVLPQIDNKNLITYTNINLLKYQNTSLLNLMMGLFDRFNKFRQIRKILRQPFFNKESFNKYLLHFILWLSSLNITDLNMCVNNDLHAYLNSNIFIKSFSDIITYYSYDCYIDDFNETMFITYIILSCMGIRVYPIKSHGIKEVKLLFKFNNNAYKNNSFNINNTRIININNMENNMLFKILNSSSNENITITIDLNNNLNKISIVKSNFILLQKNNYIDGEFIDFNVDINDPKSEFFDISVIKNLDE
jgi:hypothetical protein